MSGKPTESAPSTPLGGGSSAAGADKDTVVRAQFSSTAPVPAPAPANAPPTLPSRPPGHPHHDEGAVAGASAASPTLATLAKLAPLATLATATLATATPSRAGAHTTPQTSPLLLSTPPIVAKSLIKSYPYLLIVNSLLLVITWTNDDYWINVVVLCLYGFSVLYLEELVTYGGHLIVVGVLTLYAVLNDRIVAETNLHPTLDDVVQALTTSCIKADMLLQPITLLLLNAYDIKRLLFTTVFLTPAYLIVSFFVVLPRTILLAVGVYVLTYHSLYLRVTRKMLWRIKFVRLMCFYLTGLDFSNARNHSLFAAAFAKVQAGHSAATGGGLLHDGKPVRFTYAIYENQRRWLGIGWTSNLLLYERTPWTDEFLNELSSIDSFALPNAENLDYLFGLQQLLQMVLSGATWRWVDKTWRLDLTNDGAITVNNKRSKTTANPLPDDGFIYYDNVWKKPSTEDLFGKYTRRRRWIRTAELVFERAEEGLATGASAKAAETKSVKRKSLRFEGEAQ